MTDLIASETEETTEIEDTEEDKESTETDLTVLESELEEAW